MVQESEREETNLFMFGISKRVVLPYVKMLYAPLLIISVVVILTLVLFDKGYMRIKAQMTELSNEQKTQKVLQDKVNVLRQVLPGVLEKSDIMVVALPETNPAAWMVSQIKILAEENGLSLTELSFDKVNDEKDLKTMEIKFKTESQEYEKLLNFYSELLRVAPVTSMNEVSIKKNFDSTMFLTENKFSIFWSPLPTTLPKIGEPLTELSNKEIEILNTAFSLKMPQFTELEPESSSDRETPFN